MATRTERIEARIAPEQASRIRQAAEIENISVSAFLVSSAVARAEEVITTNRETTVLPKFFDRLLEELDKPPAVIPELARAARRAAAGGHRRQSRQSQPE
jgi:uncharacterized protein (DUF1778 family)